MSHQPITETVRSQGFAPLQADIPGDLTLSEYRRLKRPRLSRWERAKIGILAAEVVGLVAVTVASARN